MNQEYLLTMKGITKEFPGVKALSDVTFQVRRGQVLGLVGENGAGKSTLMKILSGQYLEYSGTIYWEGEPVRFHNEKQALDLGIAIVPQELNPIPALSIAENIFIGREPTHRGFVARKKMFVEADQLLRSVGMNIPSDTKMLYLSVAERQMVEIIKAISRNAKLIIMDEPSSALTTVETARLFERIAKLKKAGITIIYISHKLDEVFEVCDEVTVLRDGEVVGGDLVANLDFARVITMMVGREMSELYPPLSGHSDKVLLSVQDLSGDRFRNISFDLRGGEILGIAGMMGAGRSEVVRAIFGLDKKSGGQVLLDDKPLRIKSSRDAIRQGIVMVTEDRAKYGFVGVLSIMQNILIPNTDMYAPNIFIRFKEIDKAASEVCSKLNVRAPNIQTKVMSLSGGNQQKVVLAKWLLRTIRVLIVDEPTRGIDVGAKYEIYKILSDLAARGLSIILISSDLTEVIGMSHRIMVMADGRMVAQMKRGEVSQEVIMQAIVEERKHDEQ